MHSAPSVPSGVSSVFPGFPVGGCQLLFYLLCYRYVRYLFSHHHVWLSGLFPQADMVAKEEEQKELHRTVEELPVSIQKSKEAISQMIDLMGEIGERLDASGQCYGDLVDLLKNQRRSCCPAHRVRGHVRNHRYSVDAPADGPVSTSKLDLRKQKLRKQIFLSWTCESRSCESRYF